MGIQHFHKWLIHKYPNCQIDLEETMFSNNLFIDLNFLLHYCLYGTNNEQMLLQRIMNNIVFLIDSFNPTGSVILVTDGTPPLAKLITQRKRRILISRKDATDIDKLNQLTLTVGTTFMESLGAKLHDFILKIKKKYKINVKTIFKQSNEAEINIIKQINEHDPSEKSIIVSNDADVIILSCASDNKNIFVANVQPGKKIVVFSIKNLLESFQKDYGGSEYDFVTMMLLMGNDYLPKLHFVTFDSLLKSYKRDPIIVKKDNIFTFNNNYFREYIQNIVANTSRGMNSKYKLADYDPVKIKYYLEGLIWCLTNYATSSCLKYDYMYTDGTIQPLDLLYFFEFNENIQINYPLPHYGPVDKSIYPILILPKKAIKLLNNKFQTIIESDDRLNFLYEEELCETCINLHNEISQLHKKLKDIQALISLNDEDNYNVDLAVGMNDNEFIYKKKIGRVGSRYEKHKQVHKPIHLRDIYNAIDILKSYNVAN